MMSMMSLLLADIGTIKIDPIKALIYTRNCGTDQLARFDKFQCDSGFNRQCDLYSTYVWLTFVINCVKFAKFSPSFHRLGVLTGLFAAVRFS